MNVFAFQTVTAVVLATASFRHLRPATELHAPISSRQVFGLKFSFEKIKFTFSFEIN